MAEYTQNYNLEKQKGNDYVDIEGINGNFDIIDSELKETKDMAEQAFQSASNGKTLIKNAITGVDSEVTIPINATFQQLANCIIKIETGIKTDDATATAGQILSGATAYAKGVKVTGTMSNYKNQTISVANHGTSMSVYKDPNDSRMGIVSLPNQLGGSGYVDSSTKINAQLWGLIPENIKAGTVVGQYPGYGSGYMTGTYNGLSDIKGIIRSYYAYAGETISAGDFVKFVTGVSGVGAGTAESRQIFPNFGNATQPFISASVISDSKVLICYQESSSSGYLKFVILNIDGVEFSLGTSYTASTLTYSYTYGKLIKLSDTVYVYVFVNNNTYLYGSIITISGNIVTSVSSRISIYNMSASYVSLLSVASINSTNFAFSFMASTSGYYPEYIAVCTVSGSTITPTVTFTTSKSENSSSYGVASEFSSDGCYFAITDDTSSTTVKAQKFVISGTTAVATHSGIINTNAGACINGKKIGVINNNQIIYVSDCVVDGTNQWSYIWGFYFDPNSNNITASAPVLLRSVYAPSLIFCVPVGENKAIIEYTNGGENGIIKDRVVSMSGATPTLYTESIRTDGGSGFSAPLIGSKIIEINRVGYATRALILNAPGTEVEYYNYLYETQIKKSISNTDINGVAFGSAVGGSSTGANASHYQSTQVVSKV